MKFCYSCGNKLSGTEKFCPKCGQRLEHAVQPQAPAVSPVPETPAVSQVEESVQKGRNCSRHGVIFTDIKVLSELLGASRDVILKLFGQYTDAMADADIDYRLVDVSDYKFVSKGSGRKGERPSFHEDSPWWDYQHVLYDIICHEKEKSLPESNYLFIVGGHEVIPVPSINHYVKDDPRLPDKDIETDLLYAYPYGPHTQYALESTELYTQEMYFFTGRLPIPAGAGLDYLVNYLQNALNVRHGFPVRKIYAQCDPHWKELTAYLMSPYNKVGMLPDRSHISGHYSYGNVMLGPDITHQYIAAMMEKDTDMIFLNLHGSDDPDDPDYSGQYPPQQERFATIFPVSAMSIPEGYNVFVTEACFGGRFIGYDVMHSMIQAGLAHKTVIGVASSRVAFGGSHPPGGNADTLCGMFAAYLLSGYPAGDAMVMARSSFFGEDGMLSPHNAATLAEFNLFGDPCLRAIGVYEKDSKMKAPVSRNVAPKDFPCGYEEQSIKSAAKERSLLDMVRGAVDANVKAISDSIGKELYSKYGLPPREPETIKKLRYRNGKERMVFTYNTKSASWVVTATPDGKIESVMSSK